jgi:hypothetical protein
MQVATPADIVELAVDLKLSPLGQIVQSLFLTPLVELVVEYQDGGQETLRLTADQLRPGVQLAPAIVDLTDMELFSVASGLLNRPVARWWLRTKQPWAFQQQFTATTSAFTAANAAAQDWPAVTLDGGEELRLAAVQYDREPGAVAVDAFWEVDPATVAPGLALGHTAYARLLDDQGNTAASAEVELRDRTPGLRMLASGARRFLAARLRLALGQHVTSAVYDLEIGLTPTGRPLQNAVWQASLPDFVTIQTPQ